MIILAIVAWVSCALFTFGLCAEPDEDGKGEMLVFCLVLWPMFLGVAVNAAWEQFLNRKDRE